MVNRQQVASALAEEALEIVIKSVRFEFEDFYRSTIKALRLTCKRTKAAADARVTKFTLSLEQEPEAVQRSGLLNSLSKLCIEFILDPKEDANVNHAQELARAIGLLNLAVDVCSKSLKVMRINIVATSEILHACASTLGNADWKSLEMLHSWYQVHPMSGFLSGFFCARPARESTTGTFPALNTLICQCPSAVDIEALTKSVFVGNLTNLSFSWHASFESGTAPTLIAAMRSLLEKATNIESLDLTSSTFEFFNSETHILPKLNSLKLKGVYIPAQGDRVNVAPALAQPWLVLESLRIEYADLKGPDLVRIFEAEDTLPALKKLEIHTCGFITEDALNCVRRPYLEELCVLECVEGNVLIAILAKSMKGDKYALPSLRNFHVNCELEHAISSAREALSDFLQCPCAAALETLYIDSADLFVEGIGLLYDIVNYCPKMKDLFLDWNNLGRPAVALMVGFGMIGAWPQLERVGGILEEGDEDHYNAGLNRLDSEHPYMPRLEVETMLRRAWPGLECW